MPFVPNSRMPSLPDRMSHHTPTPVDEVPDVNDLRASDRCVRCVAQARVRVSTAGSQLLDFCAHHYDEHADALSARGAKVITDQRSQLADKPV